MTSPKAITVAPWWAWAIVHGGKCLENRSRSDGRVPAIVRYRGPLFIHAAQWKSRRAAELDYAVAQDWMRTRGLGELPALADLLTGCIIGTAQAVEQVDPDGRRETTGYMLGDECRRWHLDGYALLLTDCRPCEPIPHKGALGLWTPRGLRVGWS